MSYDWDEDDDELPWYTDDDDISDDWDRCYECGGYGDDYFINDEDELECACPTCPRNPNRDFDEDDWDD